MGRQIIARCLQSEIVVVTYQGTMQHAEYMRAGIILIQSEIVAAAILGTMQHAEYMRVGIIFNSE
jgi:hypothetical protein